MMWGGISERRCCFTLEAETQTGATGLAVVGTAYGAENTAIITEYWYYDSEVRKSSSSILIRLV